MKKYLNSPAAKFILGLVEVILALGFVLKTFAASTQAPFVRWLFSVAEALASPFNGIFGNVYFRGGGVFDTAIISAMVIYAILVYAPAFLYRKFKNEQPF